jgi:hypothetical protein
VRDSLASVASRFSPLLLNRVDATAPPLAHDARRHQTLRALSTHQSRGVARGILPSELNSCCTAGKQRHAVNTLVASGLRLVLDSGLAWPHH